MFCPSLKTVLATTIVSPHTHSSSSTRQEQVGAKHFLVTYNYHKTLVLLVRGNCCASNVAIQIIATGGK